MSFNPFFLLLSSPLHPYWLGIHKIDKGNRVILNDLRGDVIEVGSGDGSRKKELMNRYDHINSYLATDYSSWDDQFEQINRRLSRLGKFGELLFKYQPRIKLDRVCSALDLPFKDATFDYHLSFETLEHLNDPWKYFSEATRVLKPGGHLALSVPYLFRVHGGNPDHPEDFFRPAPGFFYDVAKKNNLRIIKLHHNTGLGTSFAVMINGWWIRKVLESSFFVRSTFLLLSPFVFLITNCLGYTLDLSPDKRFTTRWHVLMLKESS